LTRALAVLAALSALSVLPAAASAAAPAASTTVGMLRVQSGGFGHGVGMSQYGADGYALHGASYQYIVAHFYSHTKIALTNPGQIVRVLLSTSGQPTFSGANRAANQTLRPGVSYTVRPNANGTLTLLYHGFTRRKHQKPVPAIKQLGPFTAPLSASGSGALQLAGKGTYDGTLVFRPANGSNVQTVEAVGLDDYVSGVVPSEVPSNWPLAALKAQAVAARTYAITSDVNGQDYNLYDDTRSQAYGGVGAETAITNQAVGATSGQIVTYRGVPAITYFFSSSGGHTESVQNVFSGAGPEPWLVGVSDPFDSANGTNPYHRLVRTMSIANAAAKLSGLYRGQLLGIRVLRHGLSPRVLSAEVVGTRGSSKVTGIALQHRFGLLTDWEVFTTVTAAAGDAPGGNGGTANAEQAAAARAARTAAASTAGSAAQGMTALVPLVDTMLVQAIPGLHGTVIPAPAGAHLRVELREHGRWHVVARPPVNRAGRFDLALPGRGVYRVAYRGLTSAPLTIG
jgi:stage II sporulation protein D